MKVLTLLAVLTLAGCGYATRQVEGSPPLVIDSLPRGHHTFHSASNRYSPRQVWRAFADQGIRLRNVTRPGWRGLLAFLDARPAHEIYVYVSVGACKCVLSPPILHARNTHHGNVAVLWRPPEGSAVHAALRELR